MPKRADGYQATYGFVVDDTLYDGNPATGYERTGSPYGSIAETGLLSLGDYPVATKTVKGTIRYANVPSCIVEHSNDGTTWSTSGGTISPPLAIHHNSYTAEALIYTLSTATPYHYWRISLQDADSSGFTPKTGIMEMWAEDSYGAQIPEVGTIKTFDDTAVVSDIQLLGATPLAVLTETLGVHDIPYAIISNPFVLTDVLRDFEAWIPAIFRIEDKSLSASEGAALTIPTQLLGDLLGVGELGITGHIYVGSDSAGITEGLVAIVPPLITADGGTVGEARLTPTTFVLLDLSGTGDGAFTTTTYILNDSPAGNETSKAIAVALVTTESDLFTDAGGTDLSIHKADMGGRWRIHPLWYATIVISDANRIRKGTAGAAVYFNEDDPGSDDYQIDWQMTVMSLDVLNQPGVIARSDAILTTFYQANWYPNRWEIGKVVAGTWTSLGTYNETLAVNDVRNATLIVSNTNPNHVILRVSGIDRIILTDSSLTDRGRAGFRFAAGAVGGDAVGQHLDNFQVSYPTQGVTCNLSDALNVMNIKELPPAIIVPVLNDISAIGDALRLVSVPIIADIAACGHVKSITMGPQILRDDRPVGDIFGTQTVFPSILSDTAIGAEEDGASAIIGLVKDQAAAVDASTPTLLPILADIGRVADISGNIIPIGVWQEQADARDLPTSTSTQGMVDTVMSADAQTALPKPVFADAGLLSESDSALGIAPALVDILDATGVSAIIGLLANLPDGSAVGETSGASPATVVNLDTVSAADTPGATVVLTLAESLLSTEPRSTILTANLPDALASFEAQDAGQIVVLIADALGEQDSNRLPYYTMLADPLEMSGINEVVTVIGLVVGLSDSAQLGESTATHSTEQALGLIVVIRRSGQLWIERSGGLIQ